MGSFIIRPILPGHPDYNNPNIPYYYGHKQTKVKEKPIQLKKPAEELKKIMLTHSKTEVTVDMKKKAVTNILNRFKHYPKKLVKLASSLR